MCMIIIGSRSSINIYEQYDHAYIISREGHFCLFSNPVQSPIIPCHIRHASHVSGFLRTLFNLIWSELISYGYKFLPCQMMCVRRRVLDARIEGEFFRSIYYGCINAKPQNKLM